MSIVVTYLAYLLISGSMTVLAANVLSRSGRMFLAEALGGSDCAANGGAANDCAAKDSAARGLTSLIVVSFYLISLGIVVLTMRISGDHVTAMQAIRLLATKVGVILLVLGALYLAGIVVLTRLRRRLKDQDASTALWRPSASRAVR